MLEYHIESLADGSYHVISDTDECEIYSICPCTDKPGVSGRMFRGSRMRYDLSTDWTAKDRYDAMQHQEQLQVPYRVSDALGNERGWLAKAPSKRAIADNVSFTLDNQVFSINCYRDEASGLVSELSIYRVIDGQEGGVAAKVQNLSGNTMPISAVNDYAAEVAVLAAAYFLFSLA